MASAAAVAADAAKSPLPDHEYDPISNTTGTIRSIESADNDEDDDDDDDIAPSGRRRPAAVIKAESDEEDQEEEQASTNGQAKNIHQISDKDGASNDNDEEDEDAQGLFGEGSEDDLSPKPRRLDDEDLDSGDDLDRDDRAVEDDGAAESAPIEQELAFMDVELGRHPIPEPSDGELYLFKVPRFLSIEPQIFDPATFTLPTTDHHSKEPPSSTFSAYNTAMTTVRWRRSPTDPDKLQSNARILRWADGSLTLQLATDPTVQYQVPGNPLCPPQLNPPKPTPTSIHDRKRGQARHASYNASKDSFTYLVAPNERSQILRITNKFTTALTVQPAANAADDALERLQNSLAAAVRGSNDGDGIGLIQINEDPELAKKKAEVAEKEKLKAQKRRENQEARDRDRTGRLFGKRGGLTVGGLEDDELGMGVGRRGAAGSRRPRPKRPKRGEIYSDDEEGFGRRGRTREDEYDEEDDFVAPSDEEPEIMDDDDDEEEEEEEEEDDANGIQEDDRSQWQRNRLKERTPKRELDAEGDPDESAIGSDVRGPAGSPQARSKRRRVIDEEDEDE